MRVPSLPGTSHALQSLYDNKSTLVLNQRLACLPSLRSQGLGCVQQRVRLLILQGDGCGVHAAELRVCSRFVCSESSATIWDGSKYSLASWVLLEIIPSLLAVAL